MPSESAATATVDWFAIISTSVGLVSLIVGVVSLILAGFAIWLSLYFYNKAKETEKNVGETLVAIRTQSEALQRLTGRWMDRFTRHATEPRQLDEGMMHLIQAVASLPQTLLTTIQIRPEQNAVNPQLRREVISGYIGLYYYSSLCNGLAQSLLPSVDVFNSGDNLHTGVQAIVDRAAADAKYMVDVINSIDREEILASPLKNLLDEANNLWSPCVKTSAEIFAAQQQSAAG